jgi:hypothetical protein
MKHLLTYLTLCIIALTGMQTLQAKKKLVLPSRGEVQQMLMNSRWYIAKGEGPGGPALAGGTYTYSATHRDYVYEGRPLGKQKYKVISVRPSKTGTSYFFDVEIINADGGKSWVEEHMMKSTGSIIIRRPGGTLMGTKLKDMYLEVVGM